MIDNQNVTFSWQIIALFFFLPSSLSIVSNNPLRFYYNTLLFDSPELIHLEFYQGCNS